MFLPSENPNVMQRYVHSSGVVSYLVTPETLGEAINQVLEDEATLQFVTIHGIMTIEAKHIQRWRKHGDEIVYVKNGRIFVPRRGSYDYGQVLLVPNV